MYGKIHTELFDSSLMADGGWLPSYVFMCMVTLSDKEGWLLHDPRTLYRRIGLQEDERVSFNEFMDAVEYLEQTDDMSNLPAHDGRRIIPVSQMESAQGNRGWFVVNKIHYRDKGGSLEQRRAQDAERQRRLRERKNNDLEETPPECHVTVTQRHGESAHTDTDTDTDTKKERSLGFEEFWAVYPKKRKKKTAFEIWKRKNPDVSVLIADVRARIAGDKQWLKGFIPDPTTYLNGERWNDDMGDSTSAPKTTDDYALEFGMTRRSDEPDERFRIRVRDEMLVREGRT